ncbi:MAG: DUF1566 domain-containing protein [Bacteroidia bacterium]|nr:DUF1566 domain-containing protein [Bacteroidia bacterium]
MKKLYMYIVFTVTIFSINTVKAQVVDGITYQAVAIDENGKEIAGMDVNGNILSDKIINIRFTILQEEVSGILVYQETHTANTDQNGLFTVVIGHGVLTGLSPDTSLLNIDWGSYKHFLKVEIDIKGNSEYKLVGIQQMLAVPYAFHSLQSDTAVFSYSSNHANYADTATFAYNAQSAATANTATTALTANFAQTAATSNFSDSSSFAFNSQTATTSIYSDTANYAYNLINPQTNDTAQVANSLSGHYVGELFGGGIVFWVDHSRQHGLIASLADLSAGMPWSNIINVSIGSTAESTWDGQSNTQAIISQAGHTNSGALLCTQYIFGGFSDWYLPSVFELRQLLVNAFHITFILENDGDNYSTGLPIPNDAWYMSSTERFNNCCSINIDMGSGYVGDKDINYRVRAVRKF